MSTIMNQDKMKALAAELAKGLKTPEDLSAFSAQLTKITVEAALNAEMDNHLGYARHDAAGREEQNPKERQGPPRLHKPCAERNEVRL